MSKADEERILRLLLLATQAYQDNFEQLRKKLSEKNRDYLNMVTVQGSKNRDDIKLIARVDLYEVHTIEDLFEKVKELRFEGGLIYGNRSTKNMLELKKVI